MELRSDGGLVWNRVRVAATAAARLRGLIGSPPHPVLLRTRAVHGFWLGRPIWVVGLDAGGIVVDRRLLRRRRFAFLRRARWVLELPATARVPDIGHRLTLWAAEGEPVGHGRPPLSLRHPNREPG